MISDKLDRIFTLLAAAQVSLSEFRTIVMEIQDAELTVIEQRYARVRGKVRRISETANTEDVTSKSADISKRVRDDVLSFARASAVEPGDAAERLVRRLTHTDKTVELPLFSGKEGFSRWLERVIRIASPNAVLNAAIAEFAQSPTSQTGGWRLSDS